MNRDVNRWTETEDLELCARRAAGESWNVIALAFERTKRSVEGRWRHIHMSDKQREARNLREARRKRQERAENAAQPMGRAGYTQSEIRIAPPEHLFTERLAREMAPRTLTQALCGDPAPGWSALDRRQA